MLIWTEIECCVVLLAFPLFHFLYEMHSSALIDVFSNKNYDYFQFSLSDD